MRYCFFYLFSFLSLLRQLQQEIATTLKDEQMSFDDGVLSEMNEVHAAFSKLPAYNQKATRLAQRMKIVAERIEKLKHRCGSVQLDAYKYSVSLKKDIAAANMRSTNPTVGKTAMTDVHHSASAPNVGEDVPATTSSTLSTSSTTEA